MGKKALDTRHTARSDATVERESEKKKGNSTSEEEKTELGPGPDRKEKVERIAAGERKMGYQELGRGTLPVHGAVKRRKKKKNSRKGSSA